MAFLLPDTPDSVNEGSRLDDLSVQQSAYGVFIPIIYGIARVSGNVIWATEFEEEKVVTKQKQGGKGGGGSSTSTNVTWNYYANFAIAFGRGEASALGRVWADGKLVWDGTEIVPLEGQTAEEQTSKQESVGYMFRFYNGTESQELDSLIDLKTGGLSPPFKGICYMVFERLPLANFNNRIPNITAEITFDATLTVADITSRILNETGLPTTEYNVTQLTDTIDGYIIDSHATAKSLIEPLSEVFTFNFVERDRVLLAQKHGGTHVLTIPESKLLTNFQEPEVVETLQQTVEAPAVLSLEYVSKDLDYGQAVAHARRILIPNVSFGNNYERQFPIVSNATLMKQRAEILLYDLWIKRYVFIVNLPKSYLQLDPTDIIRLQLDSGLLFTGSISDMEIGADLSIKLTLQQEEQTVYTSNAVADSGHVNVQVQAQTGQSELFILDVPYIRDTDAGNDSPIAYWAGSPTTDYLWGGGVLYQSLDDTAFVEVDRQNSEVAYGTLTSTLPNPVGDPTTWSLEAISITMSVTVGVDQFESITTAQLNEGYNLLAVTKSNGDTELIQFQTVAQNDDDNPNILTLSNILRGRRGTDTLAYSHAAGEQAILLTLDTVQILNYPLSHISTLLYYKLVTNGFLLEETNSDQFTLAANCLKPYAPVLYTAERIANGDITLGWTRRTRFGATSTLVPLNEGRELYDIEILHPVTNAIIRTVEDVETNTYNYTLAEQIENSLQANTSFRLRVYQISQTVGRGFAHRFDTMITGAAPLAATPAVSVQATNTALLGFALTNEIRTVEGVLLTTGKVETIITSIAIWATAVKINSKTRAYEGTTGSFNFALAAVHATENRITSILDSQTQNITTESLFTTKYTFTMNETITPNTRLAILLEDTATDGLELEEDQFAQDGTVSTSVDVSISVSGGVTTPASGSVTGERATSTFTPELDDSVVDVDLNDKRIFYGANDLTNNTIVPNNALTMNSVIKLADRQSIAVTSFIETGATSGLRVEIAGQRTVPGATPLDPRTRAPGEPGTPTLNSRTTTTLIFTTAIVSEADVYVWRISTDSTVDGTDATVETTTPRLEITGLARVTQRWVSVAAKNEVGTSTFSSIGTGTTLNINPPATPNAPTVQVTETALTFTTAAVDTATSYVWRISTDSTVDGTDTTMETTQPTLEITGLTEGDQRWVTVAAKNAGGTSDFSTVVTGTASAGFNLLANDWFSGGAPGGGWSGLTGQGIGTRISSIWVSTAGEFTQFELIGSSRGSFRAGDIVAPTSQPIKDDWLTTYVGITLTVGDTTITVSKGATRVTRSTQRSVWIPNDTAERNAVAALGLSMDTANVAVAGTLTFIDKADLPPITPDLPRLSARSGTSLTFSIDDLSGSTSYTWRVSTDSTVDENDPTTLTTMPILEITGLSEGDQRWISVAVTNNAGTSDFSAVATATVLDSSYLVFSTGDTVGSSDTDRYDFTLTQTEIIAANLFGLNNSTSGTRTSIALYNSSGIQIATTTTSAGAGLFIGRQLTIGSYYIIVGERSNSSTNTPYTISVRALSAVALPFSGSGQLENLSAITAYLFTISSRQSVTVTMTGMTSGSAGDTGFEIINLTGTMVGSAYTTNGSNLSRTVTLNAGSYYVSVGHSSTVNTNTPFTIGISAVDP